MNNVCIHPSSRISQLLIFFFKLMIDTVKFKPIKIDIHQGVIKIVDDEIYYDIQLNTIQSVIVERDREKF